MLRFSPTNGDDLDINDLKIALLNYTKAKQKGEKFLIRLNDNNTQELIDTLNLFGIVADDINYKSHNLRFHQQLATKLLMDKKAFNCFCESKDKEDKACKGGCENLPDSEVIDNENPFSVRIKKPQNGEFEDFVILKVDKSPTNVFASALDDMLSDISTIIEDEKNTLNTKKENYIRESLGYDKKIEYIFVASIKENKSVKELLENGFLPDAIKEYLLKEDTNSFYIEKLKDINKKHIKDMDSLKLATYVGFKSRDIGELAKLLTKENSTINEIKEKIDKIFSKKECKDAKCKKLKELIKDAPHFDKFEEFTKYLLDSSKLQEDEFYKLLGFIITGVEDSSNLSDIYPYIKNYIKEIAR